MGTKENLNIDLDVAKFNLNALKKWKKEKTKFSMHPKYSLDYFKRLIKYFKSEIKKLKQNGRN